MNRENSAKDFLRKRGIMSKYSEDFILGLENDSEVSLVDLLDEFYEDKLKQLNSNPEKTHIKIFITKKMDFRAVIKEPNTPIYEVTIGGKSWKEGKGISHEKEIKDRCNRIIETLTYKYDKQFNKP